MPPPPPPPKQLLISPTAKYSVYCIPPPSRRVFLSCDFDDEQILKQVASLEYQVMLKEHQWPELTSMGPCLVTVANNLKGIKTRQEALQVLRGHGNDQDMEPILDGMRLAAESYLARGDRQKPSWAKDDNDNSPVPNVLLMGKFRPITFLARGSASLVYAAQDGPERPANWVLKRCYPTQMESARNEACIARKLCSKHVLDVTLLNDDSGNAWLLLPRVMPCEFGVDLREFLDKGFFQRYENVTHGQHIVKQLLEGLEFISGKGIVMRDVKPDNVLVRKTRSGDGLECYDALWTDFGLAVDTNSIRSPFAEQAGNKGYFDQGDVLNWWYDVVKLVPRPKWKFRKPPERAFQNPQQIGIFSYDIYMTAIIFASMSCGEDLPHLDAPRPKKALELALGVSDLGIDYLNTFELGAAARTNANVFVKKFEQSFGNEFGRRLFGCVLEMLSINPRHRPSPRDVLNILFPQ